MLEEDKNILLVSLTEALENWWEKEGRATAPYLGENIFPILAKSVINIFDALSDSEEYMKSQGMFKESK